MRLRRAFMSVIVLGATLTVGFAPTDRAAAAICEAAALPSTSSTAAAASPPPAGGFHAVTPVRLMDTRDTGAPVRAGCTVVLDLADDPNVPDDADAVALNVTTVDAAARGFVTVHPCGSPRPDASNVNPRVSDPTANSVLVELDETRRICLYTQVSLHLVVDMTGWFGRFGDPYHAISTVRALDTRQVGVSNSGGAPLTMGTERRLPLAGSAVPTGSRAASVNVTTTDAVAAGFVTVYPCATGRPATSTVNFLATEQRANHVVVGLDASGALCLWASASVHVVVDVEGWFGGGVSGDRFQPLPGTRVLDTRTGAARSDGTSGPVLANSVVSFDAGLGARLPLGSSVVLNVISTEAAAAGFVTAYPCSAVRPETSAVNAVVGTEATNEAFVVVDQDARVCLYASSDMHLVVDVIGTFGAGGPLHALTTSRPLLQTFTPDGHDYTIACTAGTNSVTVHAVGAAGAAVGVAMSTATPPTPNAPTPTATAVADATFGMQPGQAVVVRAGPVGGTTAEVEEYWVRCLPPDFPALQVSTTETPDQGWYLADDAFPVAPGDQSRYLMILDNRSVPVWYHRVASPTIDLSLLPDGNLAWTPLLGLAFGSTPGGAFEIHRLDGTLVRTVSTVSGPTDHHDIAALPNGDIVLATYVARPHVDLRVLGTGFGSDELVYDSHLEQIRPDGSVAWSWRSEDHIPVSATTYPLRFPGSAGTGVDLIHVNSIHIAPDGDVVISARHTDAVYKIRRDASGTMSRIGGRNSDFRFVGDPLGGFARQHDAQILPDGNLLLFDNRTDAGAPRAVEYALDAAAGIATLVWSVSDPDVPASGGVGSVRAFGDGDRVIAWGGSPTPAFTEVDAEGRELQSTSTPGHYPYRVDKQPIEAFDIAELRATAGR